MPKETGRPVQVRVRYNGRCRHGSTTIAMTTLIPISGVGRSDIGSTTSSSSVGVGGGGDSRRIVGSSVGGGGWWWNGCKGQVAVVIRDWYKCGSSCGNLGGSIGTTSIRMWLYYGGRWCRYRYHRYHGYRSGWSTGPFDKVLMLLLPFWIHLFVGGNRISFFTSVVPLDIAVD